MSHRNLDYRTLLRERGFRVTPQRELILDGVCEAGRHTTLEEVYARVRTKSSEVSLATVYRTLRFMADMGVLVSAETPDHETVYEIASRPAHHHLVCRSCHTIIQIDEEATRAAFDVIERSQGFKAEGNHLVIYGNCKECQHAQ